MAFAAFMLLAIGAAAQTTTPPAAGQQAPQPIVALTPGVGEIDFGLRLTGGLDDVGRFQRFRDPRSGPTLDRLRYVRARETWAFNAELDNVGYRDQRYLASINRFGKVKASFEWNQVPLWFGGVSATPYREESPGVFRLNDTIQAAIQSRTATLGAFASEVQPFDIRARRDVADVRFVYSLTPTLDLSASLTSLSRTGHQPWTASFGFSNADELPLPLDNRTNDFNTGAEWSNGRNMVRVAYNGSWFNNSINQLIWDNPLRITDQTHATAYSTGDGSSQGREAPWPDSTAHTVSASGSIALPARSRGFAYVSLGSWFQDESLLPHTINTAIAPIPLARESAEAEARVLAMTYRLTSRPTPRVWLSGQFRLYDFDNRTPHFPVTQYVRLDGNVATSLTGGSHPFAYLRHFADVDASFTPSRFLALRAGYGREHDDRTFRLVEETTEHTWRASVDSTGLAWGSLRLQYERSERTGEGLDEEVFDEIGEQLALRQFDISDRTRHRVSAIGQIVPWEILAFSATASVGRDHRPDAELGLQDNNLHSITIGADVTPNDAVGVGVAYAFENYSTLQRSRQANPGVQFDDPTRDWETDMKENVHTWTLNLDLPRVTSRAAVSAAYDFVKSDARYLYLLPPNSTLAPPQQLPSIRNDYHRATADLRYTLTSHAALGVGYLLDKYEVRDFGRSPETLNTSLIPAFVNMMYQWRPYDVHTARVRLIYRW